MISTLGFFVLSIIPFQRKAAVERMESEAKSLAASTGQVITDAVLNENHSFVFEQSSKVLFLNQSIRYIIVTRKDGFSLITKKDDSQQSSLGGFWAPKIYEFQKSRFLNNVIVDGQVFNYSYPFKAGGNDWGWIHIGLSLERFNKNIKTTYIRTMWMAVLCVFIGFAASLFFARRLSLPIRQLDLTAQKIAAGDRTAYADIKTGDELESLALSFNKMTEAVHKAQDELEDRVKERTAELADTNKSLQTEIKSRIRVEQALRESEERFRGFYENAPLGIYRTTPAGDFIMANPAIVQMLGYSSFDELKKEKLDKSGFLEHYPRTYFKEKIEENDEIKGFESVWKRKDGENIFIRENANVVRKSDGSIDYYEGTVEDITKRKNAEAKIRESLEEKEILLKEIHHRVKNNLQIVSSLLYLQSKRIGDKESLNLFIDSQNRIKSMALIHEKLYRSKDFSKINFNEYIKSLTTHLLQSYKAIGSEINLRINVSDIVFSIDTAIPCGLIINELISNALKYAFPEGRRGTIDLDLFSTNGKSDENAFYTLIVSDDGIGFPENIDFQHTKSLGMQLVNNLTKQLDGSIELEKDNGTQFKIIFNHF